MLSGSINGNSLNSFSTLKLTLEDPQKHKLITHLWGLQHACSALAIYTHVGQEPKQSFCDRDFLSNTNFISKQHG